MSLMPHPFDAANKHLIQAHPADWLALAGLPLGTSIQIVDADLSTVSAAADKLIVVHAPKPYAAHYEIQSGSDGELDLRMLGYNVLGRRQLKLPVKSIVFALRHAAISASVQGGIWDADDPEFELQFRYKIIRVWELSSEMLLSAGLGTLPLAAISAVTKDQLPGVIDAIARRFDAEVPPPQVKDWWAVTQILMGIRWPGALIHQLMTGVRQMKDSVIYQEILEEGVEKGFARGMERGIDKGRSEGQTNEARKLLLEAATRRFGPADLATRLALDGIDDIQPLESMFHRLLDGSASRWSDLVAPLA